MQEFSASGIMNTMSILYRIDQLESCDVFKLRPLTGFCDPFLKLKTLIFLCSHKLMFARTGINGPIMCRITDILRVHQHISKLI
jgi:hypothetical protein